MNGRRGLSFSGGTGLSGLVDVDIVIVRIGIGTDSRSWYALAMCMANEGLQTAVTEGAFDLLPSRSSFQVHYLDR